MVFGERIQTLQMDGKDSAFAILQSACRTSLQMPNVLPISAHFVTRLPLALELQRTRHLLELQCAAQRCGQGTAASRALRVGVIKQTLATIAAQRVTFSALLDGRQHQLKAHRAIELVADFILPRRLRCTATCGLLALPLAGGAELMQKKPLRKVRFCTGIVQAVLPAQLAQFDDRLLQELTQIHASANVRGGTTRSMCVHLT
mmetsp:Transcript_86788/g.249015  ORF Transcript_86788/g.249015 Transcript_86788/m.249015 type:complete len:203 (-) Transcript_86788:18-626(-)